MSALNSAENAKARQLAQAEVKVVPPLNPTFPYRTQSIDLEFFGLLVEPPIDTTIKE